MPSAAFLWGNGHLLHNGRSLISDKAICNHWFFLIFSCKFCCCFETQFPSFVETWRTDVFVQQLSVRSLIDKIMASLSVFQSIGIN
jgi:hypothetical protein